MTHFWSSYNKRQWFSLGLARKDPTLLALSSGKLNVPLFIFPRDHNPTAQEKAFVCAQKNPTCLHVGFFLICFKDQLLSNSVLTFSVLTFSVLTCRMGCHTCSTTSHNARLESISDRASSLVRSIRSRTTSNNSRTHSL